VPACNRCIKLSALSVAMLNLEHAVSAQSAQRSKYFNVNFKRERKVNFDRSKL
jgi:hypothetical protein